jgi:predicted phosphodiesterase
MNRLLSKANSLLQYSSDLHLEKGFKRIIHPSKPYLVLAGDIGYPEDINYKNFLLEMSFLFDKIFVVSGNHEFDKLLDKRELFPIEEKIKNICNMRNNLFYLQKSEHLLDKENNIYLAGCTLFSELPRVKTHIHVDHTKWLFDTVNKNHNKNYVIATHHCPTIQLLKGKYHNFLPKYFVSEQYDVYSRNNVIMWIYGHTHKNINMTINDTLFVSNQYGCKINPINDYKI